MRQATIIAKATVEEWNDTYSVGQLVKLIKDDGTCLIDKIRNEAIVVNGDTPVCWVERVTGCYLLSRIIPIIPKWRTGVPLEEGGYLIKYKPEGQKAAYIELAIWKNNSWERMNSPYYFDEDRVKEWCEIP